MKWLLITMLCSLYIVFDGCADKDAFSKFQLIKDEALAFDNVVSGKIHKNQKTFAIVSAVHLNAIYPKRYSQETFYIIIFAKNRKLLENFALSLNDTKVSTLKKLPPHNEYSHLLQIKNRWSNYYLATFPPQKEGKLNLKITLANQAATTLTFQKKR